MNTRYFNTLICIIAMACVEVTFAQVALAQTDNNVQTSDSKSPVAFVYVSSSSNGNQVDAFAAAANGKLTPVSGSPFPFDVYGMAASGNYLFGTDGVYIYTFSVASDGSIKQVASINAQQYNNPDNYGGPGSLFLDRTGATVYDTDFYCCGSDDAFQFFSLDQSTGGLSYLGVTTPTWSYYVPLSFMGSNVYAYASECSEYSAIFGFQRNTDGTLTALNINPALPVAPKGYSYCPNQLVAGPTNHLAMALTPIQPPGHSPIPPLPPQLANYMADKSGNLTTKSTRFNMPKTAVKWVTDIAMSPTGKLLAVGGTAGLQVFHFNGSKPTTRACLQTVR
jgi:hypothetical protein